MGLREQPMLEKRSLETRNFQSPKMGPTQSIQAIQKASPQTIQQQFLVDQEDSWIHTSNPQEVLCEVLTQEVDLEFSRRFRQEKEEVIISNPRNCFFMGDQAQNQVVPKKVPEPQFLTHCPQLVKKK